MSTQQYGPILPEPPLYHAAHIYDEAARRLEYVYNGRALMAMTFPGIDEPGFRPTSDGDLQGAPYFQQLYFMLDHPTKVEVQFHLSPDAVNMRPHRAAPGQAIRGQVGRPLTYGVNGLYDIRQDLLIEWQGMPWRWLSPGFEATPDGGLIARLEVEMGPMPWFVNVKPHYYRMHLGYSGHEPWAWRPNPKGVAGWCSWEAYRRDVTEANVEQALDVFSDTLRDYGLEYIQLDDGYEKMPVPAYADAPMAKSWLETNDQFPSGHETLVKKIREKGFEPGIWTCSAIMNDAFAEAYRENMLQDPEGNLVTGTWAGYLLDCRKESLEKHIRPIYEGLKAAGYSYLKIDGVRHLLYDGLQQAVAKGLLSNADAEARFRAYVQCVREGLGKDIYFLSSWGVLSQVVGVADACRISMDANPTWAGVRMQLVESARWFHAQRVLFVMDPDHICARAQFEWARSVSSLVSLSGGLFMLSDPLDVYDDAERIHMLQRCLPPLETTAGETGPLDVSYPAFTWTKLHGFAVPRENVVRAEGVDPQDALNMAGVYPTMYEDHPLSALWAFHLEKAGRRWCVAGRFATIPLRASTLRLEALGLDPAGAYHVFDFWAKRYLGLATGTFACNALELGHCQILAFVPALERPQFIASTRHVSMDAISVQEEIWDGQTLTLSLTGVPGTTETYWIHAPQATALNSVLAAGAECAFHKNGDLIALACRFTSAEATVSLSR